MTGRVLVTGYRGFIGGHLCRRLIDDGYDVVGADIGGASKAEAEHHQCDVSDYSSVSRLPKDVDYIIHLAGIAFVPKAASDFVKTYDVNFLGTYNMLKFYAQSKADNFLFASSAKVYGAPMKLPMGEDHPLNPQDTYGRSKKAAEDAIRAFHSENGRPATIVRQFNTFGPGQGGDFFIPTLARQLGKGDVLRLGNLDVRRDFLYVGDLVEAYITLLAGKGGGIETYNAGSGESVLLKDVVAEAAKIWGRKPSIQSDASKARSEAAEIRCDNTRLRALGWKPKVKMSEGLKKIKEAM